MGSQVKDATQVRGQLLKICHMSEMETWKKDSVVLLDDACHPTLPYHAQGAAMAVEDGAALGILIGSLSQSTLGDRKGHVPKVPPTLRSNAEAENDGQCPGGYREQTALPDGRRAGGGNSEPRTARCRSDGHQQKMQM